MNHSSNSLSDLPLRTKAELYEALSVALTKPNEAIGLDELTRGDARGNESFGERVFRRWSGVLHQFVCKPNDDDAEIRDRLLSSLVRKDGGGVAVVAAVLAGSFGLPPEVAALIAALLIKLVVAPAADEVCDAWSKSLKQSGTRHKKGRAKS